MGKISNKNWDVIIIGAGASGIMSALIAAKNGKSVLILEHLKCIGKKLFATGNGKCNFTNEKMDASCFHGEQAFIQEILTRFSFQDCLNFFKEIGIYPKAKNGYFYPNSEQATSVVIAFEEALKTKQVSVSLETDIYRLSSSEAGIHVESNKGTFQGKKLIIATGLLASPKLGSDGSLFEQVKSLGHSFTPVLPALCGFYCKGLKFNRISGVRAHGEVTAIINDQPIAKDCGEIQFTDYGLSGIPIFQISRHLSIGLYEKSSVQIKINLLPEFTQVKLKEELEFRKQQFLNQTIETFLNGLLHTKLAEMVYEKVGINSNDYVFSLTESDINHLCELLQNLYVKVSKPRDFEFAQICTGGIPVSEIKWDTLESKFAPNVHFVGEILDVDGICGGYNLHFAWATGFIAGNAI